MNIAGKGTVSVAGRLPLYPLEMTQRCKILVSNLFSCRGGRSSELFNCVVGIVASRWFGGAYRLHLQDCESVNGNIPVRMNAVRFFETSRANYPTARRNKHTVCFLDNNAVKAQITVSYC